MFKINITFMKIDKEELIKNCSLKQTYQVVCIIII